MDICRLSIIVPIYNVEKYLVQCIDSILSQSYHDLELILVDDGSNDKSPLICDEYASRDKRIKVIHKENGGAQSAIIAGLKCARGEYIGFVDGDDWIDVDMYKSLMDLVELYDLDCAMCRIQLIDEESGKVSFSPAIEERMYCGKEDILSVCNQSIPSLATPFHLSLSRGDKIFRKKIIWPIFRDADCSITLSEDAITVLPSLLNCERFYFLDCPFYKYRKGINSITSMFKCQYVDDIWRLEEALKQYIPTLAESALYGWILFQSMQILKKLLLSKYTFCKKIKIVRKLFNDLRFRRVLCKCKNLSMTKNNKVKYVLMKLKFVIPYYMVVKGNRFTRGEKC